MTEASPATLTILHISGLRVRAGEAGLQALLEGLRRDLGELADSRGLRPDLLVVTGDLADGGLPQEYHLAFDFLARLAGATGIPRRHVAVVPGRHDVNRKLCESYFNHQEGLGQPPTAPYFPKWQPYAAALADFYAEVPGVSFTADEPWTLFEMPDLGIAVAGLNSTMPQDHRPADDYAQLTDAQLTWFVGRLTAHWRAQPDWTRLAVVASHVLRDGDALNEALGAAGLLDIILSGTPDGPRRLPSGVPVLPARGIAGEDGRYEVVTVRPDGITRHARRRTAAGWTAEATSAPAGADAADPPTTPSAVPPGTRVRSDTTAARDAFVAGRDIYVGWPRGTDPERDTFLSRVAEATGVRFPKATVSEGILGGIRYLRVLESEDGMTEVRPVGVIDGPATREALSAFVAHVHRVFAADDPKVRSELVHQGAEASAELIQQARRQGVRLRSFLDYQGLLDLTGYTERQARALAADPLYPAELYVEQRFTVAGSRYAQQPAEVRSGLLGQASRWLGADTARLIVVLGDFGRGKTLFLRQLARRLPAELPYLTPVLVELRDLEKGPTLDDLLAQHLVRQGVEDFSQTKLRYMIDQGRIALLFDGFDELELRVGYDTATDYLQSLLNSLSGQAKVVLTSRSQHFRSTSQVHAAVKTALGDRVESHTGSRVAILEDFTSKQILEFLTNLYSRDAERARRRFDLISHIAGLLDLTRNPRMLAFVAELTDERLMAVQSGGGELTAGALYEEIVDYWLATEEQRQRHRQGLAALTKDERFQVCTNLALRMWRTMESRISLGDLTGEVAATLRLLAERRFTDDEAAHAIAAGSLLVRAEDESFSFLHRSVMEWLVAVDAAREIRSTGEAPVLATRPMSELMAAFFTDVAGPADARKWAKKTVSSAHATDIARKNALAISKRLPPEPLPERQDLSGVDLRSNDLTGQDLRGASLRGANLRGMRLTEVNLEDADLTGADLTGVVMMGCSLRGATLAGSTWNYATLLGTAYDDLAAHQGPLGAAATDRRDKATAVIEAPVSEAHCVAYSPDGALLAWGSGRVATITGADAGRTLRILSGHRDDVTAIAWAPGSSQLATASRDGTAGTWDVTTGQRTATLTGHDREVTAVAFSPDGTRVATASRDRTAVIWDAATGQRTATLTGHTDTVTTVAFSPDGTRVATASHDQTARLWDAATGQPTATLTGHDREVTAVAFSPDGTRIATASWDRTARTWDPATGQHMATLTWHKDVVTCVAFSPDGTRIATASRDGTARTWDALTGESATPLTRHPSGITAIAFSPDGTRIATASRDRKVRTRDATASGQTTTFTGHGSSVTAIAFSPDGTRIATASRDGTARTWSTATGQPAAILTGHAREVTAVAFSPDGTRVAVTSSDHTASIWDPATGQPTATLAGHTDTVTAVAFAPDGTRVATASRDSTARTWDPATGQQAITLAGHGDAVTAVAFSADGARVATASRDTTARAWDPATGQHTATLHGHTSYVTAVAWAPGGARIATASSDHTARIWDVGAPPAPVTVSRTLSGRMLRRPAAAQARPVTVHVTLQGHHGAVTDVAFHPIGGRVFTASDDGTVRIWRLAGGPAEHVLAGHNGAVTGLVLSPDGALLATSSEDGTARIWSTRTRETLATLVPLGEGGYATLLPDGSYKLRGDPGDRLWWVLKLRRFGPGELDPYVPGIRRLPDDAPIPPVP